MGVIKKCVITRYDETIKEYPFLTIPIDNIEVTQPEDDNYGSEFAERLRAGCIMKGYTFKFYTLSEDKNFDYEIVVK